MLKILKKIRSAVLNIYYFHTLAKRVSFGKGVKIDGHVVVGYKVFFDDNVEVRNYTKEQSKIGDNVTVNRNSVLRGFYVIGDNVAIGPNCMIAGSNHCFSDPNIPIIQQGCSVEGIIICNNVWIGANSVLLDGITIGEGAVIGAGSVVTKSIPPYCVAVGNPCRVIKSR